MKIKGIDLSLCGVCCLALVTGLAVPVVNAQGGGPERPPGPRSGFENKWDRRGEPERPKPFLMASDPRFEQMLKLALAGEDELEKAIQDWPDYQEMNAMRRRFLERRIQGFRDRVRSEALGKAEKMGLTIPADRENEFIRDYWTARIRIEKEVRELAERELKKRSGQVRQRIENKWK